MIGKENGRDRESRAVRMPYNPRTKVGHIGESMPKAGRADRQVARRGAGRKWALESTTERTIGFDAKLRDFDVKSCYLTLIPLGANDKTQMKIALRRSVGVFAYG